MKKFISQILDHISFTRPLLLIPIWIPAFLGSWISKGNMGFFDEIELWLLTSFIGISVYGLNQIYDIESDRLNSKNLPLSLGKISKTMAWTISIASILSALIIAFSVGIVTTILTFSGLILGILYSVPPFSFSHKPVHSLVANAIGHGSLMFVLGYSYGFSMAVDESWNWLILLKSLPYALAFGAVYLFTTFPDVAGDRRVGKKTLAVVFGEKKIVPNAILGVFLSAATGVALGETALFLTAIISMPFYIAAIADRSIDAKKIVRANKSSVLSLALLVCAYYPLFVLPLFATICYAVGYNRKILNVPYP
jgi:4-hydroxybenzoate polyprenyltransferase